KRLGYYIPEYEWGNWNIKDKPIHYLTDDEDQKILNELDPSGIQDPMHKRYRQAARDIFINMIDGGFRINEASKMKWSDIDFDNNIIYLYRSKVSNDDFIPMTSHLRTTFCNKHRRWSPPSGDLWRGRQRPCRLHPVCLAGGSGGVSEFRE
ncbi:MAG: tyrosine-type recombinase/integrase, partial [Gammaproteobacteria bacterium]|nr:tyrosine-type recombinase/integrase [Gammaproteobacteria bacterium]